MNRNVVELTNHDISELSDLEKLRAFEFFTNNSPEKVPAPEALVLYQAGLPSFPRNFTRDSIISAILAEDAIMLKDQLEFCALRQGLEQDPLTGKELGKIFHEYPGYIIDGFSTEYNACDTTALFILGHEYYETFTGDMNLRTAHKEYLARATDYIITHLRNNIFIESPAFCGSERFALRVTYWKDSEVPDREGGHPSYPVSYFLAHAQNIAGLRAASRLLERNDLSPTIQKMVENILTFFDKNIEECYIAIDDKGPIRGTTSDPLHSLFYLDPDDLPQSVVDAIVSQAQALELHFGYRTNLNTVDIGDPYHINTLWPFEQAIIHKGAKKFALNHVMEVSARVISLLDTDPEIFLIEGMSMKKAGCDPQLWTIAAKIYFDKLLPLAGDKRRALARCKATQGPSATN